MDKTRYDVFISYSHKDYVDEQKNVIPGNEISKIKESLTGAGITFWMDEKGIVPGEDFAAKILKHIKACKVFLFLSSVSANQSEWTRKEIACALMLKKHVIPVLLDESPFDDAVMMRIVDLDRIDYYENPQEGISKLISSINTYLKRDKADEARRMADEKRRQEELERQRRQQEEEKKRQEQIEKIETEIAALEAQRTERKKVVLQKEQELKLAQVDLEACEAKIQKLQKKLQELSEPKKKEERDQVFTVDGVSFKMIRVEGGSFMMGSPDNNPDAYDDEKPPHEVTLSDYYIGETQVTQALWKAVMGKNPSRFKGDNNPIEEVSWTDCQEFINKLNTKTGRTFRLPTEAEWEYAARGGNKSRGDKYAGSDNIDEVAWYGNNSERVTHPVKQKKANELGLYDMSGNVWEWCQDWFDRYGSGKETNPTGRSGGSIRVLRGGSWFSDAQGCRVAYRGCGDPDNRDGDVGFRLALVQQ